jgi:hypothetical protein
MLVIGKTKMKNKPEAGAYFMGCRGSVHDPLNVSKVSLGLAKVPLSTLQVANP